MKIKLAVSEERYEEIAKELTDKGIEIDDSSGLVLTETDRYVSRLSVREFGDDGSRLHINVDDVVYIESFGHSAEVHGMEDVWQTNDRMYQLQMMLDPKQFVRISNSVIVNKKQIKDIRPSFSQKFVLTMKNSDRVEVTRSYYAAFKRSIGI